MRLSKRRAAPALIALFALLTASCSQLADLPHLTAKDLRNIKLAESSKIYAGDGSLITTLHGVENRTIVSLTKIPEHFQNAVIAIEDERFYEHEGVDLRAILRALVRNVASGDVEEGGSTITQQYVKNTLIAPGDTAAQTLRRKINEAALGAPARTEAHEEGDPRALPQHRLLRARRLRHPSRRQDVLQQAGLEAHAVAERSPGRSDPIARDLRPLRQEEAR